jgi:hypothetical protein
VKKLPREWINEDNVSMTQETEPRVGLKIFIQPAVIVTARSQASGRSVTHR